MAVSFVSRSPAVDQTSPVQNENNNSFAATDSAARRGVLVFTFCNGTTDELITSVKCDGVSLTAVSGGRAVISGGSHPCCCTAWFLGSSVPQTINPAIEILRTNNAFYTSAVCIFVDAATDTEVTGIVLKQLQDLGENINAVEEENVTDGQSSGNNNSQRFCGFNSSSNLLYSTTTYDPTLDEGQACPGQNSTILNLSSPKGGAWTNLSVRRTSAGIGSLPVGCRFRGTTGEQENVAAVYLAIREVGVGGGAGPAVPDILLANIPGFVDIGGTTDPALGLVFQ